MVIAVMVMLQRLRGGPLLADPVPVAVYLTTGLALMLVVLVVLLRPRFLARETRGAVEQPASGRSGPILLWALLDAAGTLGAVGYLLTGAVAPLVSAAIALVALLWHSPHRLAGG
jgi:hypothetical protein